MGTHHIHPYNANFKYPSWKWRCCVSSWRIHASLWMWGVLHYIRFTVDTVIWMDKNDTFTFKMQCLQKKILMITYILGSHFSCLWVWNFMTFLMRMLIVCIICMLEYSFKQHQGNLFVKPWADFVAYSFDACNVYCFHNFFCFTFVKVLL